MAKEWEMTDRFLVLAQIAYSLLLCREGSERPSVEQLATIFSEANHAYLASTWESHMLSRRQRDNL